jgi:hypothetical protein
MKRIIILAMSLALPGWIASAAASPRKHDTGKGFYLVDNYGQYSDVFDRRSGRRAHRDEAVPRAHLPPPGKCLTWFLSRLPGC